MPRPRLPHPSPSRRGDLRALLPGLGTGAVIVAAAVLAFATIGGFVAFDGDTQRSDRASESEIDVSTGPEISSASAAGDSSAGERRASADGAGIAARVSGGNPAAVIPLSPDTPSPGPGDPGPEPNPPEPPEGPQPEPPPAPTPPVPVPSEGSEGSLGAVIGEVDEAIQGATGIDPGLGDATGPITKPVDDAIGAVTGGQGLGLSQVELPAVPPLLP